MWHYPEFDPVAISLGPISVHWYALSYLIGICFVWWHVGFRSRKFNLGWNEEQISDMIFYGVFGVILGGRIGYMLFYGHQQLIDDPLSIFKLWQGGMSFHGGMLGVILAAYLYGRKSQRGFFAVMDLIAPSIPMALGFGRLGNFINGELPGRISDVSWAVIYPGDVVTRHPSSLYQAVLEGPVLFFTLWLFTQKMRPSMTTSGMFLIGYGCFRFISESFREPDAHLGYVAFEWLTTGQLLSLPMLIVGVGVLIFGYKRNDYSAFEYSRGAGQPDAEQVTPTKPRKSKQKKSTKRKIR
ncbi:MAG: prolipoprotein diacylglyceryl transferase [Pseudomonadales bacterium]|jgi:phosphatidylglycerol:prolipoprotein diacylglycerol transferase|nr:prolipoprotein diacylglyceryl transferase [Pseudomonadales bacterium]MDG1442480.1 prolipoprotein diacylglyceryl transferase [Pseudomonadales bacterium]